MKKRKLNKEQQEFNEPQTAYLTTQALERALSKATKNLTAQEMELMGCVVTVEDNWVVRKYPNGDVEKIEKLEKTKINNVSYLPK